MDNTKLDTTRSLHQRLVAHVPPSERARFGRTLAAIEAHHRNELHAALCASTEAQSEMTLCRAEAAVASHAAAANEAKLKCAIEELRSTLVRRDVQLEQARAQTALEVARSIGATTRAETSERVLASELRAVESLHAEASELLRQVHNAA